MLLTLLLSVLLVSFNATLDTHPSPTPTSDRELMIESTYPVDNGDNLVVSVDDADVVVETYNGSEAVVEIYLEAGNMEEGKEYFENQNFEVSKEGVNVYVKTYPKKRSYSWRTMGKLNITVQVLIPSEFNVNVKTDDGDVVLDDLEGEVLVTSSDGDIFTGACIGSRVNIRTSDGDIEMGTIESDRVSVVTDDGDIAMDEVEAGDFSARSSDGDISAKYLSGVSSITTDDGDISIGALLGDDVSVRTSDGEIEVNEVNANSSVFATSDGNVRLDDVIGALTARTSDGNLDVTLVEATDVNLRAGEGNIYIRAPREYSAELYLRGERVELSSRFQFSGTLKKNQADGEINGGQYSLEARSGEGRVVLDGN